MLTSELFSRCEVDYSQVQLMNEEWYFESMVGHDFSTDPEDSETVSHCDHYVIVTTSIHMGHVNVAITTGNEPDELVQVDWTSRTHVSGITLQSPLICTTPVASEGLTYFPHITLPAGRWDVEVRQYYHESEYGQMSDDTDETIWFHLTPHQEG